MIAEPPVYLSDRDSHDEFRAGEICRVMRECVDKGYAIPWEWIEELITINGYLTKSALDKEKEQEA